MNRKGFLNIVGIIIGVLILLGAAGYFVIGSQIFSRKSVPASNGENIIKKVGEREGSFLIQKINVDSVEGFWYQAYPVTRLEGTPRTLHVGDDIGYACEGVSEKLTSIDFSNKTITFTKVVGQKPYGGCPI